MVADKRYKLLKLSKFKEINTTLGQGGVNNLPQPPKKTASTLL